MDVTKSMRSVNNRRDLVINYCEKLDTEFSMLQKIHVNLSHLHDIRELWEGEVIISLGKTQTCGVLVLAKRKDPPIEQIITDPSGRYVFFKVKNTRN